MKKLNKILAVVLLASLFTFQAVVMADNSTPAKSININLTLGDGSITVNDEKLTVEPPYLSDNTTLVPLRVITAAFGAVVTWDSTTQTVGLKYNGKSISATIGSKQAVVDGTNTDMSTAPQLHNGTTMVPLRFITENFGAKVAFDNETKKITIIGSGTAAENTSIGLNTDAGKTSMGDSFYKWSMKYPTGLVKSYQSYKDDAIYFTDANNEYKLSLTIQESTVQNLSPEGLLSVLSDTVYGTILNKSSITDKTIPYAKIVSKDESGVYNESRAYFSNGNIYIVSMDITKEANFNNPIKHAGYEELLDSFKLSFDSKNFSIKDLSTIKNGLESIQMMIMDFI
ncbi:MAG: hypothetical protein JWM44_1951 [Bacilli bacterium]|nr:hypothetical protein [Bacilli bacterium]